MKTYYITTGLTIGSKDIMYVLYSSDKSNKLKFEKILADTLDKAIINANKYTGQIDIEVVKNPSSLRNRFNPIIFNFGKYKGRNVYEIIKEDPKYCDWIRSNNFFEVKDFVTFLIKYRPIDQIISEQEIVNISNKCLLNNKNIDETIDKIIEDRTNDPSGIYYTNKMFDCNIIYEEGFNSFDGIKYNSNNNRICGDIKYLFSANKYDSDKYYYSIKYGLLVLLYDNNECNHYNNEGSIIATGEVVEKYGLQFNSIKVIKN